MAMFQLSRDVENTFIGANTRLMAGFRPTCIQRRTALSTKRGLKDKMGVLKAKRRLTPHTGRLGYAGR